jgi:hypothetical protein
MAKRILVPVAPANAADSFVTAVGDLARSTGATVRLPHVAPTPSNVVDLEDRVIAYADRETLRHDGRSGSLRQELPAPVRRVPAHRRPGAHPLRG